MKKAWISFEYKIFHFHFSTDLVYKVRVITEEGGLQIVGGQVKFYPYEKGGKNKF